MATRAQNGLRQALRNAARRRRLSAFGGQLSRTHRITGAAALAVANIATGTIFPNRAKPVTFRTTIEITANGGTHRGLVFEFGSAASGAALWIGDETVGFHAGPAGTVDGATALYDLGDELPVGAVFELVAAVNPGSGEVRLWGNGRELARGKASNDGSFDPLEWSDAGAGSFASDEQGTAVTDVPAGSSQAPAGFIVRAPLSVHFGQLPRGFIGAL